MGLEQTRRVPPAVFILGPLFALAIVLVVLLITSTEPEAGTMNRMERMKAPLPR